MTPSTFAGLAFFAASLGPGFVYLRVAGRRKARPEQSPLAEAVEMVVLGAAISLVCATGVLALARATGWLDWRPLVEHSNHYLARHPFRLIAPLTTALLLSYLVAWLLGLVLHARLPKAIHPGLTMWQQAFWVGRPSDEHAAVVTAELRDGRRVAGRVRGFTVEQAEHRELLLYGPIAVQRRAGAAAEEIREDFLVVREDELVYVSGHYWLPTPAGDTEPTKK